jgi:Arc/MetJ-type ribon-helix-helix transcriptional regulator
MTDDDSPATSTNSDSMELIAMRIPEKMDARMKAVEDHYSSRSALVRNAIHEELLRLENNDAVETQDD